MRAREFDAAKQQRQKRERRYYTKARLGRPCVVCKEALPLLLVVSGEHSHATCDPTFPELLALSLAARR